MEDLIIYDGSCNYYNCIYLYVNNVNNKKYVGKAKDFKARLKEHLRRNDIAIDKALNKYGMNSFSFYIIEHGIPDNEISEKEKYYIEYYKSNTQYGQGYNVAEGGSGGNTQLGWSDKRKEEFKHRMSKVTKGNKNGNYGKTFSEEYRRKLSEAHLGQKVGSSHPLARAVLQYDLQGNLVKEWVCIKEASDFYGIDHSAIVNNCNGRSKTCVNSIWKYKDGETQMKIEVSINHASCKAVGQYTKDGVLVAIYESIKEAELKTGATHVGSCCNGKRKTAKGFIWRYID